ncbi:MAG: synthase family protein [Sphingobacteriaceae bacterium]|jgi:phosphoglycerol transferase MdoB-like AlkP superfamily enzyme|nr:synthase family protein [Sphingobacteriaceae bacterium]
MLKSLLFCLRFFCFWLIFFFADRLIFLFYFHDKVSTLGFGNIARTFLYGLWMDASMAGYLSVIPLLGLLLVWAIPSLKISRKPVLIYSWLLIVPFSIIVAANFNIYREWGSKINYRALDFFFNSTREAVASSSTSPVLLSFSIIGALIIFFIWLSRKLIKPIPPLPGAQRAVLGFVLIALTFLAIRGGWQLSPMNESMAYFSEKPILNHAAINTDWALMHDILANKYGTKNPYAYFKPEEAKNIVADLYAVPNTNTETILTTQRPNVVVIIMESFTADVIESLGGEPGVAPNMEKLAADGILFTNIYASGDRTDKGLIGILSGFPSQATRSIIKSNNKQEKLPSLSQTLAKQGYKTSFYYGGESEFFNVKSYVLSHNYQKLVDKPTFDKKDMNSKWGAYDHAVYNKALADAEHEPQPFFCAIQTLTNHEPFELPGTPKFKGKDVSNEFRSTAFYSDSTLADYLTQAKTKPWYKNTLFIVVADHGHLLPKAKYEIQDPHRFRIPLLFYGGALKEDVRGRKVEKIGNQTDIAATLFAQMNIDHSDFHWSKDLLNPGTKEFSFFDWDNGFGFVTPQQAVSFDNVGKNVIYTREKQAEAVDDSLIRQGKAYMQRVFQEYLDY